MKKSIVAPTRPIFLFVFFFLVSIPHLGASQTITKEDFNEDVGSRLHWELERLRDPLTGLIPPGIHARELEFAKKLSSRERLRKAGRATTLNASTWTSV